jgi:cobalt-zinc-cadmium efflux system membrane fusion protein
MKRIIVVVSEAVLVIALCVLLAACERTATAKNPQLEDPPPVDVERAPDAGFVKVDHPERFAVVTASQHAAAPELNVTGVVSADVARNVPVISIASGRILEIRTRLGDTVTKGQVLMRVQSADIASAFLDYREAVSDQRLARSQFERARILHEKGAYVPRRIC